MTAKLYKALSCLKKADKIEDTISLTAKYSDNAAKVLAKYSDEMVEGVAKQFDEVAEAVSKGGTFSAPSKQVMHESVAEWTKTQESLANSKRQLDKFITATVAYDAKTVEFYYGMNRGVQLSGDSLNSELSKWLPGKSLNQYRLGNCAEVDAVNRALNSGSNVSDIYLYTINTKK